jgi:excisionase family DNA binding protein
MLSYTGTERLASGPNAARPRRRSDRLSIPPDRILTMKEAAERLACPAEVVAQLVRETTLWGTKMDDGGWGIKESELQRFIEATQRAKEK